MSANLFFLVNRPICSACFTFTPSAIMNDCKYEILQFAAGNRDLLSSSEHQLTEKDGEKGEKRTARPYLPNGVIRGHLQGMKGGGGMKTRVE